MVNGAAIALGIVFILLGAVVKSFPVSATVLGLVLFIANTAVFTAISPAQLQYLIIPNRYCILFLFKAVHSAIGYQRTGNQEIPIDKV